MVICYSVVMFSLCRPTRQKETSSWLNYQLIGPFECDGRNVHPVIFQVLPPLLPTLSISSLPDGYVGYIERF